MFMCAFNLNMLEKTKNGGSYVWSSALPHTLSLLAKPVTPKLVRKQEFPEATHVIFVRSYLPPDVPKFTVLSGVIWAWAARTVPNTWWE